MYYIYTPDLIMLDSASQYADAYYKAQLFANLRRRSVQVYYNTTLKINVYPN